MFRRNNKADLVPEKKKAMDIMITWGLRKQMVTQVKIRKLKKQETDKPVMLPMSLSEIVTGMYSQDTSHTLKVIEFLRRILCREKELPVEMILNEELFKRMASFLSGVKFSLLYETAWAFTNIAAGTLSHARMVVDSGAVPYFIRLLSSDSLCLIEQSVWALGNIAGGGADLRDLLLNHHILKPLLRLVDMTAPPNFLCTVAWAISNLCRNKVPSVMMIVIKACLPALRTLIHHKDDAVVSHACWGLSCVTEGALNYTEELVKYPDLMERLVELLDSRNVGVLTPTLQTIGNIMSENKSWIQIMMDCNLMDKLPALLQNFRLNIRKESCRIVSCITMGFFEQIKTVIDCNLIPLLLGVLKVGDIRSQIEAVRAIKNMSEDVLLQEVYCLVKNNVFRPLCEHLTTKNVRLLDLLLDTITNIIEISGILGPPESLFHILEETNAVDTIKQLQNHNNWIIRSKSHRIYEKFFSLSSDEESAPENHNDDNQDRYSTDEY
ncbi:unnamed protein product [Candidula unifasciata]|uniref:Importin subunit alpha n=1 Tax=Candidula unifasciata TaxID=100452 RepID=A0A8S3ZUQ9_9EUPU|nr:unnamed protein product [Candidula unifasciata]